MAEAPFSDEDSIPCVVPIYEDISSSPQKAESDGNFFEQQNLTFDGSLREAPPANGEPKDDEGDGDRGTDGSSDNSSSVDEDLDEEVEEANSHQEEDVVDSPEKQLTECFEDLTTASSVRYSPVQKFNKSVQEDDDGSEESSEEETRKKVRVGNHYQARIPKLSTSDHVIDKTDEDQLLWNPHGIDPTLVDAYLGQVASLTHRILPVGRHVRDSEDALYVLQQRNHRTDDALAALRDDGGGAHPQSPAPPLPPPPSSQTTGSWSDEECRSFERGFVRYGKNFYMIQKRNLSSRPVGELVQFYYLWKKSERYDLYAGKVRANKKKYTLNPGVPDLTHKYLHLGSVKGASPSNNGGYEVQLMMKNEAKKTAKVTAAAAADDGGAQY